jgi:hypothetical protein
VKEIDQQLPSILNAGLAGLGVAFEAFWAWPVAAAELEDSAMAQAVDGGNGAQVWRSVISISWIGQSLVKGISLESEQILFQEPCVASGNDSR